MKHNARKKQNIQKFNQSYVVHYVLFSFVTSLLLYLITLPKT